MELRCRGCRGLHRDILKNSESMTMKIDYQSGRIASMLGMYGIAMTIEFANNRSGN